MDLIIHNYYINLLVLCLNKANDLEKSSNDNIVIKVIDNKIILNKILFDDNYSFISENNFIIKTNKSDTFENIALFNSEKNKSIKKGKIICFLEEKFNINKYFNYCYSIFNNNFINIFDKSSLLYTAYNINEKYQYALIIMEDFEQLDFYNLSNIEIKNISELETINTGNKYKNKFIENNSKLIINKINAELKNDILNDQGIYLILNILLKSIKYLNKEDLLFIFKYFLKFYNKYKSEENNYPFMSLEFIVIQANKYFQFKNIKTIYKENKENNKSFYYCTIKDNILEINRNLEYINNNIKINLINAIDIEKLNNNVKNVYSESYKLSNLSFYHWDEITSYERIFNNSILFIKPTLNQMDLSKVHQYIKDPNNNIRVIILGGQEGNIKENILIDVINTYSIPIYRMDTTFYEKLIDFFIKGIGANYVFLYKSNQNYRKEDIFNIFKFNLDNNNYNFRVNDIKYNRVENIIKRMSKNKLRRIKGDLTYKTELCMYYEDGFCRNRNNCDFAHGDKELDEIEMVRDYLLDKNIIKKRQKLNKFNINRQKLENELEYESKNIFTILNIKLSKRLLFYILLRDNIKLSEIENIYVDTNNISYNYEVLGLEYYFNCENNIFNESLLENIINFFRKLLNDNSRKLFDNKLIKLYLQQIENINNYQNEFNLSDLNIINLYN